MCRTCVWHWSLTDFREPRAVCCAPHNHGYQPVVLPAAIDARAVERLAQTGRDELLAAPERAAAILRRAAALWVDR
jgi:hypothetical protein